MKKDTRFSDLLNLNDEAVVPVISEWVSRMSDEEHKVRSAILDIHFEIEFMLKHLLYHCLRATLLFSNEQERDQKAETLRKTVERLPVGTAMNLLEATVKLAPWPDLSNIWEINKTRNKLAHRRNYEEISYKGRNPFKEKDCLAEMYFDAWAIDQTFPKLFERVIDEPLTNQRYYQDLSEAYRKKFGELPVEEHPNARPYPEW